MKRSRLDEEQIIAILREQEAGAKTAKLCRKHGIGGPIFYTLLKIDRRAAVVVPDNVLFEGGAGEKLHKNLSQKAACTPYCDCPPASGVRPVARRQ